MIIPEIAAATCPAMTTSSRFLLTHCVKLCKPVANELTRFFNGSSKTSPTAICIPSNADSKVFAAPSRLSDCTNAIFAAIPCELSILFISSLKLSSVASTIAKKPACASSPAIFAAYSAFSAAVKFLKPARKSFKTARNGFIVPSALTALTPNASSAAAASFGGETNRVKVERNAVPAIEPLTDAFAIKPVASATSSIE